MLFFCNSNRLRAIPYPWNSALLYSFPQLIGTQRFSSVPFRFVTVCYWAIPPPCSSAPCHSKSLFGHSTHIHFLIQCIRVQAIPVHITCILVQAFPYHSISYHVASSHFHSYADPRISSPIPFKCIPVTSISLLGDALILNPIPHLLHSGPFASGPCFSTSSFINSIIFHRISIHDRSIPIHCISFLFTALSMHIFSSPLYSFSRMVYLGLVYSYSSNIYSFPHHISVSSCSSYSFHPVLFLCCTNLLDSLPIHINTVPFPSCHIYSFPWQGFTAHLLAVLFQIVVSHFTSIPFHLIV